MASADPVTIEHLTIVRGTVTAVDDVSLRLQPGTITGLLGPSGSGKTTLMRAIVGSQRITSGSVLIQGQPAGSARVRDRIGYMSQLAALYADLTVEENLRYFGSVLGVGAPRIQKVIERIDIGHRRSAMVRTLSGGESSRVSLGVALLGEPEILVLDEPTVGLDPLLRRSLWDQFRELADAGVTLIVSSHVMEEAERCDRLILMRDGSVLFDGDRAGLNEAAAADTIEEAFIRLAEGDPR